MLSSFLSRSKSKLAEEQPETKVEPKPLRVLVTGAAGQTGCIVVRKLLERGGGQSGPVGLVRALVRSRESAEKLRASLAGTATDGLEVAIGDITEAATLDEPFKGIDALVVATSAMPRISKVSLAKVIAVKLASFSLVASKPTFWYDEGQTPEQVDWLGQRAQFEAATAAGVRHVVVISSMCGTKPDHFLNTHMDSIVLWKRKAESFLVNSKLPYTIIHPGGLLPHAGGSQPTPGGKRQLYVGVDDELMASESKGGQSKAMVPREDVAEVVVRCLLTPEVAIGRSFDLGSGPEGEGQPFAGDLQALLATLDGKNCTYTEADSAFCALEPGKTRGCYCA